MLDHETLGLYSVGNAGVSILGAIPSALGQMLFVKFAEMEGQQRTKAHMAAVLDRTTMVLSILFAPILVITIATFPLVVVCLLPQYVKGIAAGQLLIASVFFLGSSLPVSKWCVSTGRSGPVLVLRLVIIMAEFAVLAAVIHHGTSLEAIALCILSAWALFSLTMIVIGHVLLAGTRACWPHEGREKSSAVPQHCHSHLGSRCPQS
jgi:O-antigen/teichoic acid export membrane protein